MNHEILLALCGHTGDVIVEDSNSFKVRESLSHTFISDADRQVRTFFDSFFFFAREMLNGTNVQLGNEIVKVGHHFRCLDEFVRDVMKSGHGVYKRALAVGLTKILNEYREAISKAEIRFIRDESLSVLELRHFLSRHFELIPILNATVNSLKRRDLKGLQISDFLYVQSRLGSPIAKECFEKLLQHCHRVMFNQMISWLLHGELVDYYGEFFVEERNHGTSSFDPRKHSGVVAEYEWKHQHRLKFSMLPRSFLPARLAEKILFVGKAVHIVRRSSSADWRSQSQENMYAKMFLSLRDHPQLRIMDLEQAVDRVQNFMATQLLHLILLEGHLGGAALGIHLNALRDTFLLGDGHFFSVFIESSLDVMKRAATHHSERDLNLGAWRHACTYHLCWSLNVQTLTSTAYM